MALTPKQRKFIDAYFQNGMNATRAAITAGYSEKTARQMGSENLSKPDIKEAIEQRLDAYSMSTNEVLARLTQHGRGDMREFIGLTYSDLKWHPDGPLIKELDRTIVRHKNGSIEESYKIKLYDAQSAMNAIWKYNQIAQGKATEVIDVLDAKERLAQLLARQSGRGEPGSDPGGTE